MNVTLVDGRVVPSDAEAWRHECLARHVLRLPGRAARMEWLDGFEKRHGGAVAERLKTTMLALHEKGRTV